MLDAADRYRAESHGRDTPTEPMYMPTQPARPEEPPRYNP
jgi:hypothetical protein